MYILQISVVLLHRNTHKGSRFSNKYLKLCMCYLGKMISKLLLFLPRMKITNYINVRGGWMAVYERLHLISKEILYTDTQQGRSGELYQSRSPHCCWQEMKERRKLSSSLTHIQAHRHTQNTDAHCLHRWICCWCNGNGKQYSGRSENMSTCPQSNRVDTVF